ncbi:MAG: CdaR family protein, partial [Thermodesulfobacteriota bacterium]|nr:CdaR family protein [Thermodesulfobacteriota bacterium]
MSEQNNTAVDKRKLQIFLVFLLCSFLIWLISKLSENYTERTSYELVFVRVPDSLLLTKASKDNISARIQTSGFQMLSSGFKRNQINIDVSQARIRGNRYYISPAVYRRQMEQQLSGSVSLQEIDSDTLFLEMYALMARKVPVRADVEVALAQNYMMKGEVQVRPDSIIIRGPENEVQNIKEVTTEEVELLDLDKDFSREVALNLPEMGTSISMEVEKVLIQGEVFRFSEKLLEIPVQVLNQPEDVEIKIFPNTISVLCRAELEQLKTLEPSQFTLEVDFSNVKEGV